MRIAYPLIFLLLLACDLGTKPEAEVADEAVEETAERVEDDTTPELEPIAGCDWLPGLWELTDCADSTIELYLSTVGNCSVQVIANHPAFTGAWGQAKDNALGLFLPAGGMQCQASYDGERLRGACGTLAGPCAIEAIPVDNVQ